MKQTILISAFFIASLSGFAQSECGKGNILFKTDNRYDAPKPIYSLDHDPQFPFLRNLSSSQQVASAIRRNHNKPTGSKLNQILMDIGFANGGRDITAADISADNIPAGTIGNMGDGGHNTHFVKLMADGDGGNGIKAWKITSLTGCSINILSKCGNAFYPSGAAKTTACVTVPVNLISDTHEVTLDNRNAVKTTTENVYIYYSRRKRERPLAPEFADLKDPKASNPVLLSTNKNVEVIPQSYKVTISTPNSRILVCEDKPLDLTANVNVEKTGSYTGYYPSSTKKYKEVSKRTYKKAARKMCKAQKKQQKVAKLTGTTINTEVALK